MDTLAAELAASELIPLSRLLDLGRKSLRKYFSQQAGLSPIHLQTVFSSLVRTTCSRAVGGDRLTAGCNALSVFIQSALISSTAEVRDYAFSSEVWTALWSAIHRAFSEGKVKPALQLMEAMVQVANANPQPTSDLTNLRIKISELVRVLVKGQPESQLKETCVILSFLLRKLPESISLSDYLVCLDEPAFESFQVRCLMIGVNMHSFAPLAEQPIKLLFLALLLTARLKEPRTAALKLFSYLCSKDGIYDYSENISIASRVIQTYLEVNAESLTELSAIIFPTILVDESQFRLFSKYHNPSVGTFNHALETYLGILEVGRVKGFLTEEGLRKELSEALLLGSIDMMAEDQAYLAFDVLLSSSDPQIRLRAVKLLIMSPSTNLPISTEVLACFYRNLEHIHNDSDPYYRDEFISYLKRFLQRIERSTHVMEKHNPATEHDLHHSTPEHRYRMFLENYLTYLTAELGPHVSYPRHILALRSLDLVITLATFDTFPGKWPDLLENQMRTLMCLLLDPFDDVRSMSSSILQQVVVYYPRCSRLLMAPTLLQSMRTMAARTNRADHADALGRLYLLTGMAQSLGDQGRLVENRWTGSVEAFRPLLVETGAYLRSLSLVSPTSGFPLHGNLLGIAYHIDKCPEIDHDAVLQVFQICSKIWDLVYRELCIDSPERTTEIEQFDEQVGPKDLLAYSWRALRDSSIVVQSATKKISIKSGFQFHDQFGSLCLAQLIHLRHRGAFSTVAQTFASCCDIVRTAGAIYKQAGDLLSKWQHEAFCELDKQGSQLTRRSAGLPAIFSGLLDAKDIHHSLSIIDQLITIASTQPETKISVGEVREPKLPQVHALNCLKDIMTNSKFRLISETLVGRMLGLATLSMGSSIWAMRNCGLMLLRACINRLSVENLDYRENSHAGLPADGHEETYVVAIKLLENARGSITNHDYDINRLSEHVFAALDLLGRLNLLGPSNSFMNIRFEQEMSNAIWAIREHAAMLRASAVEFGNEFSSIKEMLSNKDVQLTYNSIHGKLLCIRATMSEALNRTVELEGSERVLDIVKLLGVFRNTYQAFFDSPFVAGAYLDIINDIYSLYGQNSAVCEILDTCSPDSIKELRMEMSRLFTPTLHRALVLNTFFRTLCRDPQNFMATIQATMTGIPNMNSFLEDPDALLYALEGIERSSIASSSIVDFYIWLTLHAKSDDIRAHSMLALANVIQCSFNPLSASDLLLLDQTIKLDKTCSRTLLDAEISLSASIAAHNFSHEGPQQTLLILPKLLNSLQYCLIDEVETSSRLNATFSLGALSALVSPDRNHPESLPLKHQLRTALMLYDLLNDDEEEIRKIAAGFSHSLIRRFSIRPDMTISACAIAARKGLLTLLQRIYGTSSDFITNAVGRILGTKPAVSISETQNVLLFLTKSSVDTHIKKAIHRATDLFAEEDQNLYIDTLSEVQIWSDALHKSQPTKVNGAVVTLLTDWIQKGLPRMEKLLREQYDSDQTHPEYPSMIFGPLGPIFNKDVLILSVRVVAMAGLLLRLLRSDDAEDKASLMSLHQLLVNFIHTCRAMGGHETLMSAFQNMTLVDAEVFTTTSLRTVVGLH